MVIFFGITGATVFLVVMLLAQASGDDVRPGSHLRLRAWHHAYLGAALLLVSFLPFLPTWLQVVLRVLGLGLLWDDAVQHAIQFMTQRLDFRGLLWRAWAAATKGRAWARRLEEWLDGLFGSRPA